MFVILRNGLSLPSSEAHEIKKTVLAGIMSSECEPINTKLINGKKIIKN